jgi:formate hydrogenlyase subunit 4
MTAFTLIHVGISLAAILSGLVVLFGMLTAKRLDGWTAFFLATTVLTSATGFFFPFHGVTPAIVVGIISLVVLAVAIFARYARNLSGVWRKTYVVTSVFALYFNVFVLIVQAFQKIPALKEIAPTQNDPPFRLTQLVVLVAFIVLGILATIRFRAEPVSVSHSGKEIISAQQIQT